QHCFILIAPSHKVDLWRRIHASHGNRSVQLKWRERNDVKASGITLGYRVKWFPEDRTATQRTETTTLKDITIQVSGKAYLVSVVSYNSAGVSPAAFLRIPADGGITCKLINYIQILKWDDNLIIKWNATAAEIGIFVVEWHRAYDTNSNDLYWQYIKNSTEWTPQKGTFEPYTCFILSVYPLVGDKVEASSTVDFYFKEGAPRRGPSVTTKSLSNTEVTLKWDTIPEEDRNGFITNYTIFYQSLNGKQSVVTVDYSIHEYTLQALAPNTLHSVYVTAGTQAGSTCGNIVHFNTMKYNKDDIGRLFGGVGMSLGLLFVLAFGVLCAQKRHRFGNLCLPDVPSPADSSMADWPSNWTQTTTFLLNTAHSDGMVHSDLYVFDAAPLEEKYFKHVVSEQRIAPFIVCNSEDYKHETRGFPQEAEVTGKQKSFDKLPDLLQAATACNSLQGSSTPPHDQNEGIRKELITSESEEHNVKIAINPYLKNPARMRDTLILGYISK
uniref:Fibronectin type-III domain-containing protein n=1 Tax=Leptobrachium leishanense TaxID=445787 RepID=A0A8C5PC66_9ANUR